MRKILIYPGHKLTKASPAFLQRMEELKAYLELRLRDCAFLKFLGVTAGTRGDVYDQDILTNVATCDLFIAIVDEESTGLGIELGAALWKFGRPILVLYSRDAHVSRLIGGAIDRNPEQMLERSIASPEDALAAIREAIAHFRLDLSSGDRSTMRISEEADSEGGDTLADVRERNPAYQHPAFTGQAPSCQCAKVCELRKLSEHIPDGQAG